MIRRAALFLLLLAGGFLVLHFATGELDHAGEKAPRPPDPQPPAGPPPDPVRGGVQVGDGDREVVVSIGGPMTFSETRPVADGDRTLHLPVYRLECLDSEPLEDNLLRLDEVLVRLYDEGEHFADLTAIEALVEIGRDPQGQPSIRQDKDMDLSQVVLRTLPGARGGPLRMETDRARARVAEQAVEIHTPSDLEPVLLLIEGERGGRLAGRGLQVRLPRRRAEGPSRIDIQINRSPALTAADGSWSLSADGRLQYLESARDGSFLATVADNVTLGSSGAGDALGPLGAGGPVEVRGNRLSAWGFRHGNGQPERSPGKVAPRLVVLEGAPAELEGPGLQVSASSFALLPAPSGEPLLITAAGAGPRLTLEDASSGDRATFTAGRRIHVVRPAARLERIYRGFGFPAASLGLLRRFDLIRFEGETTAVTASGLRLQASKGLLVLRPGTEDAPLYLAGFGRVEIRQPGGEAELVARGNRGFVLLRSEGSESLVLGPEEPVAEHAFTVTRGELELHGTGACRFSRAGADDVTVDLRSDAPTIGGRFGAALRVQGAAWLRATLAGGELADFEARGPELAAAFRHGDRDYRARGRRFVQVAPDSFRLEGEGQRLAEIERAGPTAAGDEVATWSAGTLLVHRIGSRLAVLEAPATAEPGARLRLQAPAALGRPALDLDLLACRLRLSPWILPPSVLRLHAGWLPAGTAGSFGAWLRQPVLLAEGQVRVQRLEVAQGTSTEVHGDRLIVPAGMRAGLLLGSAAEPAHLVRRQADGQELQARAPAIRLAEASGGEHLALLAQAPAGKLPPVQPQLFLFDPDPEVDWGSGGPMRLRGSCRGDIEVRPDRVDFLGPVRVQGILADGSVDPRGADVRSRRLYMLRDPDSGTVTRIEASGEVVLDWYRVRGRSSAMSLDLSRSLCTIADPDGAEVWLPGIPPMHAKRIEANYSTMAVRLWKGAVRDEAAEARR